MVSIIVPYAYDRGWLREALDSIEDQDYDGQIEVVEVCRKKPLVDNINFGIMKSTGEYICYLCDDDLLPVTSIRDRVEVIKQGYDFVHGCAEEMYPKRMEFYRPRIEVPTLQDMVFDNVIHGGTVMYRRDCFERWGLFREGLMTGEEYELNMRFISQGAKIGFVDSVCAIYRKHDGQKSNMKTKTTKEWLWRIGEIQQIKNLYDDKTRVLSERSDPFK
jgi:glycosyltransferase involved in cell wall biosynthesis